MSGRSPIWPWVAGGVILLSLGGGAAVLAIAYQNGKPIGQIKLVNVAGRLVEEKMAKAFLAMQKAALADGIHLTLSSGFRTMEQQARLYETYLNGTGNYAARPGYSNHQNGTALDISVRSSFESPEYLWLAENAADFGFENTGRYFKQPEPWHWELIA